MTDPPVHADRPDDGLPRFSDQEVEQAGSALHRTVSDQVRQFVGRVEQAATVVERSIGRSALLSVVAALVAWGVLFGIRSDDPVWIAPGVVVGVMLLVPAAALLYVRRQLRALMSLPDQLSHHLTAAMRTVSGDEIRRRIDEMSGKRGLRLLLALASNLRWAQGELDTRGLASTTDQAARAVLTVPVAAGIGGVGTTAVVLLVPVFAVASALLALVS